MTNREPGSSGTPSRGDAGRAGARAAEARAGNARERALEARAAAEGATTESARRAYHRVADLHASTAVSQEDCARTLRYGAGDAEKH
jgi:hypothetical protein